jgi:hypothetical protein
VSVMAGRSDVGGREHGYIVLAVLVSAVVSIGVVVAMRHALYTCASSWVLDISALRSLAARWMMSTRCAVVLSTILRGRQYNRHSIDSHALQTTTSSWMMSGSGVAMAVRRRHISMTQNRIVRAVMILVNARALCSRSMSCGMSYNA